MSQVAGELQSSRIKVIAVGVGSDVPRYKLEDMASTDSDVHTVESFGGLQSIVTKVAHQACEGRMLGYQNVLTLLIVKLY